MSTFPTPFVFSKLGRGAGVYSGSNAQSAKESQQLLATKQSWREEQKQQHSIVIALQVSSNQITHISTEQSEFLWEECYCALQFFYIFT